VTWKFIKNYAFAIFFIAALVAAFAFTTIGSGKSTSFQSRDCLPGYDEMFFGEGAYACQRSK
jgi:hypothetical protein